MRSWITVSCVAAVGVNARSPVRMVVSGLETTIPVGAVTMNVVWPYMSVAIVVCDDGVLNISTVGVTYDGGV